VRVTFGREAPSCGAGQGRLVVIATVTLTVALVVGGCGGSSGGGSSARAGGGSKPLTSAACAQLDKVLTDLDGIDAGQLDYKTDVAAIDSFADTVKLPDAYVKPVGTIRGFVDDYASAAQDIGIPAGQPPLPDQVETLRKKMHLADRGTSIAHAMQTLDAWTSNSCRGSV
jgi:hypothetical protein